jgi:hypothetical protein
MTTLVVRGAVKRGDDYILHMKGGMNREQHRLGYPARVTGMGIDGYGYE